MLLTLTVTETRSILPPRRAGARPALGAIPRYVAEELGLHGLNLTTDLLAGVATADLEALRESADKARCSCLLLIEPTPLPLGSLDERTGAMASERARRILQAGVMLGCNAVAVKVEAAADEESSDAVAERLKPLVARAEKQEVNLLISPSPGLGADPARLTELIKSVGGFRIGTFPDFQAAAATDDPITYLRRLTPYAGAVSASTVAFAPAGTRSKKLADPEAEEPPPRHTAYELEPFVRAVISVGFDANLAVEYRGEGDATLGIRMSHAALEDAIRRVAES